MRWTRLVLIHCLTTNTLILCYSEHDFALFPNDISTFLHRNNSPPENSLWKCDPHAGCESHFSKQSKKVKHALTAQTSNVVKSLGDVQETCFSTMLAAEGLNKPKLALPRSMGIKQIMLPTEHGDHTSGIRNPIQRENVQIATHALHPQEQKVWLWHGKNDNITLEGLQKLKIATPPSMGSTKKCERHRAWECHFWLFEHLPRDTRITFWGVGAPSVRKHNTAEQPMPEYWRA